MYMYNLYIYIYIYIYVLYMYIYMCVIWQTKSQFFIGMLLWISCYWIIQGYYLLYKRLGKETYNKEIYGFTKRIVFCILYLYFSLPENSFCRVSCRVATSGLIITANGLAVFYMRQFLADTYCRGNFGISAFVYFR